MIIVDTSVWIDHFRTPEERLLTLLHNDEVFLHPMVLGELAVGRWQQRQAVFEFLGTLKRPVLATEEEFMLFVNRHRLYGRGVGYVDLHLLASSKLTVDTMLWTKDRQLSMLAGEFALAANLIQ